MTCIQTVINIAFLKGQKAEMLFHTSDLVENNLCASLFHV